MNILLLGDIVGPSGRKAIIEKLPEIIKKKEIDFAIVNGENAGDMGVGITKKNFDEFMKAGADVVTTGNHVWDEKEAIEFITLEKRLLRPQNLVKGSPSSNKSSLLITLSFVTLFPLMLILSTMIFFPSLILNARLILSPSIVS